MKRPFALLTLATVAAFAMGPHAALAQDNASLRADWNLHPDSTRPHPKARTLAVVAPVAIDLVRCRLGYGHTRYRDLDTQVPGLRSGGKIKVTLELVDEGGTTRVAKARAKVRVTGEERNDREAGVAWAESAVPSDSSYKRNGKFPLHLEPGTMLLWTVQLKGMPAIASELDRQPWYQDGIGLGIVCHACGTTDSPCPDEN